MEIRARTIPPTIICSEAKLQARSRLGCSNLRRVSSLNSLPLDQAWVEVQAVEAFSEEQPFHPNQPLPAVSLAAHRLKPQLRPLEEASLEMPMPLKEEGGFLEELNSRALAFSEDNSRPPHQLKLLQVFLVKLNRNLLLPVFLARPSHSSNHKALGACLHLKISNSNSQIHLTSISMLNSNNNSRKPSSCYRHNKTRLQLTTTTSGEPGLPK